MGPRAVSSNFLSLTHGDISLPLSSTSLLASSVVLSFILLPSRPNPGRAQSSFCPALPPVRSGVCCLFPRRGQGHSLRLHLLLKIRERPVLKSVFSKRRAVRDKEHAVWFCGIDNLETKAYNNKDPPPPFSYTKSEHSIRSSAWASRTAWHRRDGPCSVIPASA